MRKDTLFPFYFEAFSHLCQAFFVEIMQTILIETYGFV